MCGWRVGIERWERKTWGQTCLGSEKRTSLPSFLLSPSFSSHYPPSLLLLSVPPKCTCWNANPQAWWYVEVGPLRGASMMRVELSLMIRMLLEKSLHGFPSPPACEDTARRKQVRTRGHNQRTQPCRCPDRGLAAARTGRCEFLWFISYPACGHLW